MLDAAGVLGGGLFVHAQHGQHFGQQLVAAVDVLGHGAALLGQGQSAGRGDPMLIMPAVRSRLMARLTLGLVTAQPLGHVHAADVRGAPG